MIRINIKLIEIDAGGNRCASPIRTIPEDAVFSGGLSFSIREISYNLAGYRADSYTYTRRPIQTIGDGGLGVEWVGIILAEGKLVWLCGAGVIDSNCLVEEISPNIASGRIGIEREARVSGIDAGRVGEEMVVTGVRPDEKRVDLQVVGAGLKAFIVNCIVIENKIIIPSGPSGILNIPYYASKIPVKRYYVILNNALIST